MQSVADAVNGVRIGEQITYRNLTIFPLFGSDLRNAGYITLDEALERKCSVVSEISDGGSVPELKFVNSGALPVFLLDGEELVGAKQNRILNLSILAAAGKTLIIPVSCVESGRWSHRTQHFASAPRAHYAEGRARKMAQVSASLRATGQRRSDQSAVWDDIREKSAKFCVSSETAAMSDIFEQESASLEDYVRPFSFVEGQLGAVFAIGERVAGFDLFDSSDTFRKLFPKLLRSYGLDALDRARQEISQPNARCSPSKAHSFLERVGKAKIEEFPAVGEG
ncbi:MAG TPA: DUF6569 family protein, partial [Acidobacteriota bacterium]|nr:DUF6569 family protein [Acidobacteriota bacterium]